MNVNSASITEIEIWVREECHANVRKQQKKNDLSSSFPIRLEWAWQTLRLTVNWAVTFSENFIKLPSKHSADSWSSSFEFFLVRKKFDFASISLCDFFPYQTWWCIEIYFSIETRMEILLVTWVTLNFFFLATRNRLQLGSSAQLADYRVGKGKVLVKVFFF